MGLLSTWSTFSTYIDADGQYRVIWEFSNGRITIEKFETFQTEIELARFFDKREENYDGTEKLVYTEDSDETVLKNAIFQIRTHPSLTLAQYNTYLAGLNWYDENLIRSFIFKLAIKLSEKYGIVLDNMTETEILLKLRNWIVNANVNVLKRACFGYLIEL